MSNKTNVTKKNFKMTERTVLTIEEFLLLPEVPMQRNTEERAKMSSTKRNLGILHPAHPNVILAKLTKTSCYHGKNYPKDWIGILDGNTRRYIWDNDLSDAIPENVNATIYLCDDMEIVMDLYNTFDNPDSSEKTQQKVYGILHGLYNYSPKSSKISSGAILSALKFSCHKLSPGKYPSKSFGNSVAILPHEIQEYLEEIKAFDKMCLNSKYWDQALIAAAFMSLKKYGTMNVKLNECLSCIDKRDYDNRGAKRDGVAHICVEWMENRIFKSKNTGFDKLDGLNQTVSFALYWIEKYMAGEKLGQPGHNWDKVVHTWFAEFNKINSNLSTLFNLPHIEQQFKVEEDAGSI